MTDETLLTIVTSICLFIGAFIISFAVTAYLWYRKDKIKKEPVVEIESVK